MNYLKLTIQKGKKTKYLSSTPEILLSMILKDYHDWNITAYEDVSGNTGSNHVNINNIYVYESDEDEVLTLISEKELEALRNSEKELREIKSNNIK